LFEPRARISKADKGVAEGQGGPRSLSLS
jgi:hypothetical protein